MIDLKTILKQYPNCLNSRAFFKSVLMDKYPTQKRDVNILTLLFECGIANKIKTKKNIDANEIQGFMSQMENEYGILGQYSQEAILVWAAAFDVTASAINTKSFVSSSQELPNSVEQKPVVYVQGDINDYEIVQRSDGYYITHFNGFEEEVMTIPSLIDGKKIKGIAQAAFKGCVIVKTIHISEGIEIIENCAFKECQSLENILLPDTLRKIGSISSEYGIGAFESTNLKAISIPQGVEFIGPYTFNFCWNLRSVELPDKVTIIHEGTFNYCKNLSNVKLPKMLSTIKSCAFSDCECLKEVHIPVGTKQIEEDAFKHTCLTAVYIPPTVIKIGNNNTISIMGDQTFGSSLTRWNMTIYCTVGSAAMEYARKNNIKCAKAQF